MTLDRYTVAALLGTDALVVGGGTALAGTGDGDPGPRCQAPLAKIAERRDLTVEQLEAAVKMRLLARVDAALAAGRITSEQAATLRERIARADFCSGTLRHAVRHGLRKMLAAAADYLGLTPPELRDQLHGTSLAALAAKEGKSVDGLETAMLAPAKARLAQ